MWSVVGLPFCFRLLIRSKSAAISLLKSVGAVAAITDGAGAGGADDGAGVGVVAVGAVSPVSWFLPWEAFSVNPPTCVSCVLAVKRINLSAMSFPNAAASCAGKLSRRGLVLAGDIANGREDAMSMASRMVA